MMPENMPAAFLEMERRYQSNGFFRTVEGAEDGTHTEVPVCNMWYWLARMVGARNILETGTYQGYSTCLLAAAVRDNGGGSVVTIDPWVIPHLWENSELAQYISWLQQPSQEVLEALSGRSFDILVVDSEHTYRQVSWELSHFEPLLRPGGIILLHDSLFHDGVGCAVAQLHASGRFESITFDTPRRLQTDHIAQPVPMGLTMMRKKQSGPALQPIPDLLGMPEHTPDGPLPLLRLPQQSPFRSVRLES